MKINRIKSPLCVLMLSGVLATNLLPGALADEVVIRKGTDIHLVFDSKLDSTESKPGDKINFHVEKDVEVDGKTVILADTKVSGVVEKINKRARYGKNASVSMHMRSVKSVSGKMVMLEPKTKGQVISGETGDAAAATVGGAILLGPLGLAGGYFVVGKNVHAKPGDKTTVEVSKDTSVTVK